MASNNYVITDQHALKVCILSGIEQKRLTNQLITLKDLREGLNQSLRNLDAANKDLDWYKKVEVAARIISVICDSIVSIGGWETKWAGMGIGYGYDFSKLIVKGLMEDEETPKEAVKMVGNIHLDVADKTMENAIGKEGIKKVTDTISIGISIVENYNAIKKTLSQGSISGADSVIAQMRSLTLRIEEIEEILASCTQEKKVSTRLT